MLQLWSNLDHCFDASGGASVQSSGEMILLYTPMQIEGKVAYCRKAESGKLRMGVMLQGTQEENVRFVKKLIRAYRYQKK